ncbi:MAG: hypothetical protein AAB401_00685, partial [Acidobacteriota bacterium]
MPNFALVKKPLEAVEDIANLPSLAQIAQGIRIPTGGYGFTSGRVSLNLPPSFRVRGTVSTTFGDFYDGTRQT